MFSKRFLAITSCMAAVLLPLETAIMAQQPAPAAPAAKAAMKTVLTPEVLAERPQAIYKAGEDIIFNIRLLEGSSAVAGKTLEYIIKGDGGLVKTGKITTGTDAVKVTTKLSNPGLVLCTVYYKDENSKNITGYGGAAVDPLQIRSASPVPADFDAFWARAKTELAAVPLNAKLEPVEIKDAKMKAKVRCFDVKVDCAGGMPVSGYLAVPADAKPKSCPAIVSYHGAGVRSANQPLWYAARGFIAMDVNAHGLINGQPEDFYKKLADGELKDYRTRNSDNPENIYFRGMYLRVLRALEFMKSRPEWDGRILVVVGTSQGGGQSLVAAGLDPQVTCCVAYVPALCHHLGVLDNQSSGWPRFVQMKDNKPVSDAVVKTVPYYDAANFAARIKNAECLLSTGYIDTTCAPTSVYVAFNNIPSAAKTIVPTPTTTHSVPKETYATGEKFIDAHVAKMKAQK